MNNKVILVAKKEWDRFFGDKRMVISALLLPAILLYWVYVFLAPSMINLIIGKDNNKKVYAISPPSDVKILFEYVGINLTQINDDEKNNIIEGITEKDGNVLIEFPHDFIEKIISYQSKTVENAPEIKFYYNSLSDGFIELFTKINTVLNTYERNIIKVFDINVTGGGDLALSGEKGSNFLTSLLPMFILVFIYYGAIASGTESITGEKERGTLSTILITPVKPVELAAGKIISLGVESFLCGLSGSLGILLSLPKFIESLNTRLTTNHAIKAFLNSGIFDITEYNFVDICILILLLLSCSCFIVSLVANISIHAKTAKEAQLILSPLLMIIMLISLLAGFTNGNNQLKTYYYLIPIYNSVQSINYAFNHNYSPIQIGLTIFSNVFYSAIGIIILSNMYKNEKIIASN